MEGEMKKPNCQPVHIKCLTCLVLIHLLITGGTALAIDQRDLKDGEATTDGLTVMKSTMFKCGQ